MTEKYSAADSMLGYLYQARVALLFAMERPDDAYLTIERFDDVAFQKDGTPLELIQVKHHRNSETSLSDSSADLWKTVRIWCTALRDNKLSLPGTSLTLITTGQATEGSIASYLSADDTRRNSKMALQGLRTIASESQNTKLRDCFASFMELDLNEQSMLSDAIVVFDAWPTITDVVGRIQQHLMRTVHRDHRALLYERLEGWWFAKVIRHLDGASTEPIAVFDVNNKIIDLGRQFTEDSLPIDYRDAVVPTNMEPNIRTQLFVRQLQLIAVRDSRIASAIRDYYRAFSQRSRWVREDLIVSEELESYERLLIEEWQRHFDELMDRYSGSQLDEIGLCKQGQELYRWMEQDASFQIRARVSEKYVMRGTYHYLADRYRPESGDSIPYIWWHPKFLERLNQLLNPQ